MLVTSFIIFKKGDLDALVAFKSYREKFPKLVIPTLQSFSEKVTRAKVH